MNEKKLHLVNGKWEKCTATKRKCKYNTHANNIKEAQKISDEFNENKVFIDKHLKTVSFSYKYSDDMTLSYLRGDEIKKVLKEDDYANLSQGFSFDNIKQKDQILIVIDKDNPDSYADIMENIYINQKFQDEIFANPDWQRNNIVKYYFNDFIQEYNNHVSECNDKELYQLSENSYGYKIKNINKDISEKLIKQENSKFEEEYNSFVENHKNNQNIHNHSTAIRTTIETDYVFGFIEGSDIKNVMTEEQYKDFCKRYEKYGKDISENKRKLMVFDREIPESYSNQMINHYENKEFLYEFFDGENIFTEEDYKKYFDDFIDSQDGLLNKETDKKYRLADNIYGYFKVDNLSY